MSEIGEKKLMKRGWVVVGAILIQLCLGAIYAWSVFTPFLVPGLPKPDRKTGEYKDRVVFFLKDDLRVSVVVPKEPKLRPNEKKVELTTIKLASGEDVPVLKSTEGDVPPGYPHDKSLTDHAMLVPTEVVVAVSKEYEGNNIPWHESLVASASEANWSNTRGQAVFAAGLAAFAVVMVVAGRMMPKVGPKVLAMAGGVVPGAGYVLAGVFGAKEWINTFVFVGLVGGAGIGLAYVVPIAVGMRWFPDKKGMITGLAVAGFGFGALLWVKLAGTWGFLLADYGIDFTFIVYGIVFLVSVVIGGIWMVFPPAGWAPKGYVPPQPSKDGSHVAGAVDFTSGAMLRTPQFYMILLTFAFGASAGLMSIGLMKQFPMAALREAGFTVLEASAIAGTAMGVFFALANGIGRIAWGMLSDKLGRKASIFIMLATQGVLVICFQWMAGAPGLLYLGAALIGFNFGGNFALFPTITADTFGTKYVGQNYGWVFLAYGVGGIFGPVLGGKLGDLGNFPLAFTICGGLCIVAAVIIAMVKHPKPKAV